MFLYLCSDADKISSSVQLVYSTRPGMGKSLYIKRLTEQYQLKQSNNYLCVPIHGPDVTANNIIKYLLKGLQGPEETQLQVIHFDLSHSVCQCSYMKCNKFSYFVATGDSAGRLTTV